MKAIFIFFFALCISFCLGKELPYKDGKVYYQLDVYNSSLDKKEIFERCNNFVSSILNGDNVVVQHEDRQSGEMVVKAMSAFTKFAKRISLEYRQVDSTNVYHTFSIL
ncbi:MULTISPECIES: DUF4468 domain-containing protein [Sphingobacterium]|uniref:DUF4468 domain-containing protein n=1 Tax=Sphingobacterium populi TaxID=1812824 RepID=A0ABW5UE31_9SPHI|nr:DUF4468 domain-containing protein [Sphingobacterium sp. CFCC 11742]